MSEPREHMDVTSLKNEFLECPVCNEYYNHTTRRPRLLKNCLHSVCTACLDKLLQKEGRGQLTCPVCKHVEKFKGNATSLPIDPLRSKLGDFLHLKQQRKIKCTDCPDGNDADGRCDEYQSYLCKECINAHKRNHLSRDHNISSIEDALKVPIKEFSQNHFCPKHPKQHIEFYCTTDEEICCVSCTVIDHKGHQFEKIQDAADKRKSSLLQSIKGVNKTKSSLQERQKSMKAKKIAVEKMTKESERNINKMMDEIMLKLDQRRNKLLSELQQKSSAMLSVIEKISAAYDTTLAIIESADTYFTQTKEKADDVEMLQMYPAIKRSVDALQSQPVASDVRINENRLKFLLTKKTTFDGLVSKLGSFKGEGSPSQADQGIPVAPRTMTFTQPAVYTVAQGRTLNVKLYKGDMTTLTTDVIVREVKQDSSPLNAVSTSVADAAGPQFLDQLQKSVRGRASATVVITDAGNLPCKKVFNIVLPYGRECVIWCLCEAANRKFTSIAFPCIYYDLIQEIKSFDQMVTGGFLQEVHIVADDDWQFSWVEEPMKNKWTKVSKTDKKDVDVILKLLQPSSEALLFT